MQLRTSARALFLDSGIAFDDECEELVGSLQISLENGIAAGMRKEHLTTAAFMAFTGNI